MSGEDEVVRKRKAILLGTRNIDAFRRMITRAVCGAGFDPYFAIMYNASDARERARLAAELQYDDHQPLWVRVHQPQSAWWIGRRGGRRHAFFSYDAECEAFRDLERRADTGEVLDVDGMALVLGSLAGRQIPTHTVRDLLRRQGFVRLGLTPAWNRRRQAVERRLGHLRRLEREVARQTSAKPSTPSSPPDDADTGSAVPSPSPEPYPTEAQVAV